MSLRRFFTLSLTFCFLTLSAPLDASASKRVALVVGNNDYTTLAALNNAEKDARDMAQTLRGLGWEVVDLYNSSQRDMGRAIAKFEGLLMTAEAGLFFYAGHGIQANGDNWLVPIDADVEAEVDLQYEAIGARNVLTAMKNADVPVNIVILDACRDNPLKKRTRSASRGLKAPEVPSGIRGTTILFSAAPGEVAQDGPQGGNGVFTGKLLAELKRPGQTLEEVFKATARGVNAATNRSQMPWFNSSLSGDFYFNEAKSGAKGSPVAEKIEPLENSQSISADTEAKIELAFWKAIKDSENLEQFLAYKKRFPEGTFSDLADLKISSLQNVSKEKVRALRKNNFSENKSYYSKFSCGDHFNRPEIKSFSNILDFTINDNNLKGESGNKTKISWNLDLKTYPLTIIGTPNNGKKWRYELKSEDGISFKGFGITKNNIVFRECEIIFRETVKYSIK